ncbi:unnamed protein product, partial [Brassica oleracea]
GENQCAQRCSQEHVQCREAWQEAGHDQAFFQSHHQVPHRHAEARYAFFFPTILITIHSPLFFGVSFLGLIHSNAGYIGEFEYVDDHRSGKIVVELNGRLNKCGVISPRFDVGVKEIEGWTARLLPSRQVREVLFTSLFLIGLPSHCSIYHFYEFSGENSTLWPWRPWRPGLESQQPHY